jgi:uncharacterized protein YozE (UPF0346 family)
MAQASGNISGPPPAPQKGDDVLRWAREMYNWAKKTQAIPGANILSTQTQSGRVFNARTGGAATPPHPFKVINTEDRKLKVSSGKFYRQIPWADNAINATETLTTPTSGELTNMGFNETELPADFIGYVHVELRYTEQVFSIQTTGDGSAAANYWRPTNQNIGYSDSQFPQYDLQAEDFKAIWVPLAFVETDSDNVTELIQITFDNIWDTYAGVFKNIQIDFPSSE